MRAPGRIGPKLARVAIASAAAAALTGGGATASADVAWLCHPEQAENPCEIPLDTTVREPDGSERVVTPRRAPAQRRRIDCFYVYPTVSNQPRPLATKSRDPELVSIANFQAAPFSRRCRVFSPIYRQRTTPSLLTGSLLGRADRTIPYADVEEAFREYLSEHPGRGFVLIGHSQGTSMLRALIRRAVESRRPVLDRFVGGVLLGGNVAVERGRVRGGDFERVPVCTRRGQFGCVVAFSTFAKDPPANTRFGRVTTAPEGSAGASPDEFEVVCTDPGPLSGIRGEVPVTIPTEPFAPGLIALSVLQTYGGFPPTAATSWQTTPDRYAGSCERIGEAHVYRYVPVGESRAPRASPDATWGTHLLDVNLGLERLVEIVRRQARSWLRAR